VIRLKKNKGKQTTLPRSIIRQLGSQDVPMAVTGLDQDARVREYAEENKCDYATAFDAVLCGLEPVDN
jgi:hypothetical protein